MSTRAFNITKGNVEPCPKCGNQKSFAAHSQQVAEDLCEVWIVCTCGLDPSLGSGDRMEDVWGSLDKETILEAVGVWNDLVTKPE